MTQFVPEDAIDYDEVLSRGGRNCGDEDFALFKCPNCDHVYLLEYEVDTVYLNADDLSHRVAVDLGVESFDCVSCNRCVPANESWIGKNAADRYRVTWNELASSPWRWVAKRPQDAT